MNWRGSNASPQTSTGSGLHFIDSVDRGLMLHCYTRPIVFFRYTLGDEIKAMKKTRKMQEAESENQQVETIYIQTTHEWDYSCSYQDMDGEREDYYTTPLNPNLLRCIGYDCHGLLWYVSVMKRIDNKTDTKE